MTSEFSGHRCSISHLGDMMREAFARTGMADADAAYMTNAILASELSGHACHGVRRFPEYIARWHAGFADPLATMHILRDTGPILRADGRRAFGHLFLRDATDMAIARAKTHGICLFSGYGSEAAGRLADHCERAAEAGIATLFFVNDSGGAQAVAPPGGTEARLSTNPIAFGVPRKAAPHLVLDMATSAVAMGRLSEERDRGSVIPDEWVNAAGVLKPFGGFKGFGLALIAEALSGALSGGGVAGPTPDCEDQAFLLIAIDIGQVRDLDEITADVERFIDYVKSVPLEPGTAPVRMPGEAIHVCGERVAAEGVSLSPSVLTRVREALARVGMTVPQFLA